MRVPLGFADIFQLARFTRELGAARGADGGSGHAHVIGSAALYHSLNMSKPEGHHFDRLGRGTSDIDVVLRSTELLLKMQHAGGEPDPDTVFLGEYAWLRNDGPTGFLTLCPNLRGFVQRWSRELRRPVDLRLLLAVPDQPSTLDEMTATNPPPIELFPFAGVYPADPERFRCGDGCRVNVTGDELQLTEADGGYMALTWVQLDAVDIETRPTSRGTIDVVWVIGSGGVRALLPVRVTGGEALARALRSLRGFDHEAMSEAMGSTEDRVFTCWRRGG